MRLLARGCTVAGAWLLASCANYGPIGTPAFEQQLHRDVPELNGKVLYQNRASFIYGMNGEATIFRTPKRVDEFNPGHPVYDNTYQPGVLLVTDDRLYFLRWHQEKYQRYWEIEYKKIKEVGMQMTGGATLMGGTRWMTIVFNFIPHVITFTLSDDKGFRNDSDRMLTACKLIAKQAGRECIDSVVAK